MSTKAPKPVGYLRATITVDFPVLDLAHYNDAKNLSEAAKSMQQMMDAGDCGVEDILGWGPVDVKFQVKP